MGEPNELGYAVEEFSPEEEVILGLREEGDLPGSEDEAEPDESAAAETDETDETDETEETAETEHKAAPEEEEPQEEPEAEASAAEEEEELTPTQQRINKLTWEKNEEKRKNDLLKRDPDKYYALYPEEKAEPEEAKEEPASDSIPENLKDHVLDGGPYNGMTLAEAREEDPEYVTALITDMRIDARDAKAAKKQAAEDTRKANLESSQKQVDGLRSRLAKSELEKDAADLTDKESAGLDQIVDETLDWMDEQRKQGNVVTNLGQAYTLRMADTLESKAKATKALLKTLKTPAVPSVSGKKGVDEASKASGYEAVSNMGDQERADYIRNLDGEDYAAFKEKAPDWFKEKFPDYSWG